MSINIDWYLLVAVSDCNDAKKTMVQWLTLDDLVAYLHVPKSTVYKLSRRHVLPGHKVGRRLLFDPEEVDAHIKRRSRTPRKKKVTGKQHGRKRVA